MRKSHTINKSDSDATLALLTLINNAKDSINFAIYGIGGKDEIFRAFITFQVV